MNWKLIPFTMIAVSLATNVSAKTVDEIFQQDDTNGDGRLSKSEMTASYDRTFSKIDKNGDGKLVREEVARSVAESMPPAMSTNAQVFGSIVTKTMQTWDENNNDKVTPDEYRDAQFRMMELADANKDGAISKQELVSFRRGG